MSRPRSEDELLGVIDRYFPEKGEQILLGRGDDCAVLGVTGPLCVSTDMFIEDVHFRRSYFTPEDIGWKALAVNLSDLAACGARPSGFTVGLAFPDDADMELMEGLCAGMAALSEQSEIPLLGGDLSRAERLHLCVTIFGQAEKTLLRGMAMPGDLIFLAGHAGLARSGMELLEAQGRDAIAEWPLLCDAHLRPHPRLREGIKISRLAASWAIESGDPDRGRLGLMDLSDGLARDLPRLVDTAGTRCGAEILLPPPHPELIRFMESRGETDPYNAACNQIYLGGEDYALIGTCDPAFGGKLMVTLADAVILGRVTDEGSIRATYRQSGNERQLKYSAGFDHFA